MLSVETRGKVLIVKPKGEVEGDDLEDIGELIEKKIAEHETASVLLDLRRYDGAHDLQTAWQELKLVTHFADQVDKVAVVGSLDWQKLATALWSPFTRAHERFFEPDDMDEASRWLRD